MSSCETIQIIKDSKRYAHDTTPLRLQCPGCINLTKEKTKVYKNISSLYWHISTQHNDEFWIDDLKQVLQKLSTAIQSGVLLNDK